MQKIGFFGGSFNPPTNAHISLAKEIVNRFNLDKLVFVPIGDFYKKKELINFKFRYEMLEVICSNSRKLQVSNIEENQKSTIYAIDVFEMIKKEYPSDDLYYIMGTDNLKQIKDWKGYRDLVSKYKYIVLEREKGSLKKIIEDNEEIRKNIDNFIIMSDEKYMNISSSMVREKIRKNEDVNEFVPKEILDYIKENQLYE